MTEKSVKMSRKDWRKLFKKNRRKRHRQKVAQERDRLAQQTEQVKLANPNYVAYLREKDQLEREAAMREEERSRYEHALWLDREREARVAFEMLRKKREEEQRKQDEERERIRKEFEELERKAKEAKEEKQRLLEELRRRQLERERLMAEYLAGIDDHLEGLGQMVDTRPGANACGFFGKIGVCRYGIRCSSNHPTPGLSQLLLIPNFFAHPALDDRNNPEYGTDSGIEFDEDELYRCYKEFFHDIIAEFESFGSIQYIFVCRNHAVHLRGNVFIQYDSVRSAAKAQQRMNGRFYASRQLHVEFRSPISWPAAVCGLFEQSRCQKGKNCNYLHLMRNPVIKYRYCHSKELHSVRESQRMSQRSQPQDRSWDDIEIPAKQRTNWRWSETPEVEAPSRNGRSQSRLSRERSDSSRSSRSGRSHSSFKERSRKDSDDRRDRRESRSGSDRSRRSHREDRSSEHKRKKKKRSRSKSKERSSQRRHKESRSESERKKR
uniref:U2 small nuclear ribonucleoprotein auxiliary factor 35 kDa subunit-related protein 1 n=1 Tax=Culex pipiens TaxID=7175 RepID=A0A8D8HS53_CULPI